MKKVHMTQFVRVLGGVSLGLVLAQPFAKADPVALRYELRVDVPVTVLATTFVIGSELTKGSLAATTCRWCDRATDGTDSVNVVDSTFRGWLRWNDENTAGALSSVVGFGLVPAASIGLLAVASAKDDSLRNLPVDALLVAEAVSLSASLNQIVKFSVGRERPFVHALDPRDKGNTAQPSDNNTSFYSGHTNLAFSLAVSAGTVASLRRYRIGPWVTGTGLLLAAATGYLRIAADKHYFTDVLAGATMGSATGFLIPFVFHQPVTPAWPRLGLARLPQGVAFSVSWFQ